MKGNFELLIFQGKFNGALSLLYESLRIKSFCQKFQNESERKAIVPTKIGLRVSDAAVDNGEISFLLSPQIPDASKENLSSAVINVERKRKKWDNIRKASFLRHKATDKRRKH